MMKKVLAPLVLLAVLISSCGKSFDGYQLEGTLTGLENQEVMLEFLSPKELIAIDTATVGDDGSFSMEGNVKDKGFYRLISGQKFWIFLLENGKQTIVANGNDPALRDVTISNYPEGEEFQKTINFLISKQEEFQVESTKAQTAIYAPESTDLEKMQAQSAFEAFQNSVMDDIKTEVSNNLESNTFSSVYLLSALNPQTDGEFIKEKLTALDEKLPNNIYVQNIKDILVKVEAQSKQQEIDQAQAQQVAESVVSNETVPDIIMNSPDGKEMKLSDLRGKVVLVDFWASWCKPCRAENPNVVRMYHKYKNQGFDIFSVSLDKTNDAWKKAIAKDGLVWNSHVSDLKFWSNAAAKAWGVKSIPATFLLDKEGKVIAQNLRGAALEAKLKEVL